jgi:iron only hydrogenase large subunit-like protein
MGPIETVKERCRKCYSCVRNCPVKAIKVGPKWAEVIHARCIGCGKCLKVCSQQAKVIANCIEATRRFLSDDQDVIAVLGCSYPAFFNDLRPGQLVSGLKKLGFSEVHEGSAGVELIAENYQQLIHSEHRSPLISSHCPTIVDLIERHYPQLLRNLLPVVSPMVAIGRFLKARRGRDARVVYISSCIAGKFEVSSEEVAGAIDIVLTYSELNQMFRDKALDSKRLGDSPFDGRKPDLGRLFPIAGGPFQTFDVRNDFLNPDFISTGGAESSMELIRDLAAGRITPRWVDVRFCEGGCIGGPGKNNRLTTFAKRNLVIQSFQEQELPYLTKAIYAETRPLPEVRRNFSNKLHRLEPPSGDSIRQILQSTNKFVEAGRIQLRRLRLPDLPRICGRRLSGTGRHGNVPAFSIKRLEEDHVSLSQKYELAQRALAQEYGDPSIIGNDPRTLDVHKLIRQVGPTPTTVLIRGESGTGKELTARAIHEHSNRADKPLVTVNCTTLTDSLLESELFGHKKGSFTGAIADKKGLFEAANGGTIFLDEIGDITPKLQAELLRVLDSGELKPVGGTVPHRSM